MPTNLELARPISSNVEIGSINLREAAVSSRIDPFNGAPEEVLLSQSFRASYEVRSPDQIFVQVELNFQASEQEDGQERSDPVVSLSATFGVMYRLKGDIENYDEAALNAFAELNGPYNAWPYWRELVNSVAGRVGIATVVVPVFKLPVREVDDTRPKPRSRPAASGARAPRKRSKE
jgi:hypothetical protein